MLRWIIDRSLAHRWLVVLAAVGLALAGSLAIRHIDVDAFPDTTPVQVQINTTVPSLGPLEVERQITTPIEQALNGLPKIVQMRSISKFGLSQVVIIFEDSVDIYFARQVVIERLSTVNLPGGVERPKLGPVSTGLGEVFHYVVTGKGDDVTTLRTIHDWNIRPLMRKVPGVAEVNSWGGYEKQFQVRVDPARLAKFGLTLDGLAASLKEHNLNVGGGALSQGGSAWIVHGIGQTTNLEQIGRIKVSAANNVPVLLRDVAEIAVGHEVRRGAVTADGRGEAVLGLGFLTMGENSHEVTWQLKHQLNEIKTLLPRNVQVEAVYDRTELVDYVIDTVRTNLFEGGLLVVVVLYLFLGNVRAAFIVALAIPLSMLFAFNGMLRFGIAASLLSLGAIDFGMVVDSSVVAIENCVRHLSMNTDGRSRRDVIREAALEVRTPTLFGELIILIVYLPILTLEGTEGKLFRPMALTVIFALAGSMLFSITLLPALASLLLPRRMAHREPLLIRVIKWLYGPILRLTMRYKLAVVTFAVVILAVAFVGIAPNLGTEFIPKLSEGALALNIVRPAGTPLEESILRNSAIERAILKAFPDEVAHVFSRVGSAEIATDPMGIEVTDMYITLKPRRLWKRAATQDDLTVLLEQEVRDFPGQTVSYEQPIEMRINEMETGIRADLGILIFGDDLTLLKQKAAEAIALVRAIPGAADVTAEALVDQPFLQIKLKPEAVARSGLMPRAVLEFVELLGTKPVSEVTDGTYRFPLVLRLSDAWRNRPDTLKTLEIPAPSGERIPLGRLADIAIVDGPSTITREWGQRRISVSANVRDRDLGSFVKEVQKTIGEKLVLPPGRYSISYGGQFEKYERAKWRLIVIVPVALALIVVLLYLTYGNLIDTIRVLTGIPFAWVGGLIAIWLRDMPFSISAGIGFIALSGVAVLDDMILVSRVRQLLGMGWTLDKAVEDAAITRLRPVLMTSLVASLGFLPMAFSTGMGAEVQRPLATVVIGGVVSAMIMSLLVLRVLYVIFQWPKRRSSAITTPAAENTSPA